MSGLPEHFEKYLGRIESGWTRDFNGVKSPFQVALFAGPFKGVKALATLGMSNTPLRIRNSDKKRKQELLIMFREDQGPRNLPGILQEIGMEAIKKNEAYDLNDIIGPRGPIIEGSPLVAFLVGQPVYYLDDDFAIYSPQAADATAIGWLIPISRSEGKFIDTNCIECFEAEILKLKPDLTDFFRKSIV